MTTSNNFKIGCFRKKSKSVTFDQMIKTKADGALLGFEGVGSALAQ
jgi:hypothetical protein